MSKILCWFGIHRRMITKTYLMGELAQVKKGKDCAVCGKVLDK